jgi:uncharacterized protein YcgI (DUF1989 family)
VIRPDFGLETHQSLSRAGDFIEFEAQEVCLVAVTACPRT